MSRFASPVSNAPPSGLPAPEVLRQELLKLRPDGEGGLEGLVAHCLAALLSRQFRVARAGRQHGRDGATLPGAFDVFFEAKLYSGKPPSTEELQSKLMSAINAHQPQLDVWVAAATTTLGENSLGELQATGERFAVTVVAIDWSPHPLPPLAVLLAATQPSVTDWFHSNVVGADAAAIEQSLLSIGVDAAFPAAKSELTDQLTAGTAGFGTARMQNIAWLKSRFSNRIAARQAFGQFIAPDEPAAFSLARPSEVKKIVDAIEDRANEIVAVTGDEGTGKTWLTALAWNSLETPPILLLCTNESAALDLAAQDGLRFLARLVLDQTGDAYSAELEERWMRRLQNWASRTESAPRIWLSLDGLNERESRPWVKIIDQLMALGPGLGVRLILTSRPTFFSERIAGRLSGYTVKQVRIVPFSNAEVVAGLRQGGVNPEGLSPEILEFLRNPRIFSIAFSMLDRLSVHELRPERLLFEYWRRRTDERRSLRHSDPEMRQLLVSHARAVRRHFQESKSLIALSFRRELWKQHSGLAQRVSDPTVDDELSEVESGAFFEPDTDGLYRLRPEGLPYVLGLLIVDELRTVAAADVVSKMDSAIDPIRGLDLLANAMLAALGIACIDERCSDIVAAGILHALLKVQNLPDDSVNSILAYVASRPGAFIAAAETLWREDDRGHGRYDWIGWLLVQRREHPSVQTQLDAAIRRWLGFWCREPDRFPHRSRTTEEKKKDEEDIAKRRSRIADRLSQLSDEERTFLERYCHEVETPQLMRLDALAVELLAGRPVAPFAEAIVAWQLATSLSSHIYGASGAERELLWLLRLNPSDSRAAAEALRAAIAPFQTERISQTGLWTCIGTLRSTGRADDAARADDLAKSLAEPERYRSWSRIDNFCDTNPLDPDAALPTNIDAARQRIEEIAFTGLRSSMSMTMDDHDLRDLTPALARFMPEVIVDKLRAFARDLANRSGIPARFLAFDLANFSALFSRDEVTVLRAAYSAFIAREDFKADTDQLVAAQYILLALLPHLAAEEQLAALLELPDYKHELLNLRNHCKNLDPDVLARHLMQSEKAGELVSLRRTLFFASASAMPLVPDSRKVVGRCFANSDPVIRLLAFSIAVTTRDEELLTKLVVSDWSALNAGAAHTEAFYGSMALARAPAEFRNVDTLMRMTLGWQTSVVDEWGEDALRRHADIVLEQMRNSLKLPAGEFPDVTIRRNLPTADHPTSYPYLDANVESSKPKNAFEALRRLANRANSDAEWTAEQKRTREAVNSYLRKLKEHGAERLIDCAYTRGFAAIARRAPDRFAEVIGLLDAVQGPQLPSLCNITCCAAVALSRSNPEAAATLLAATAQTAPDITLTIGGAQLHFHRLAFWMADDSPSLRSLRFSRIRSARDDAELSVEVLCAAYVGKQAAVLDIALELISEDHPGSIARGLILAGFCDANDVSARLFASLDYVTGFLGHVADRARTVYKGNLWARHWYRQAQAAGTAVEWWRFTELAIEASDGRFVLWNGASVDESSAFVGFTDFAWDRMKTGAEKKRGEYAKTFLSLKPPSDSIMQTLNLK
jgi:hypothetical protein